MRGPLELVRSFARRHGLWHPRLRVLAAVSGGSDSVAMFLLLSELAAAGELELAGLAHVNHHIRPGGSDDDEAFCRALATRLGVPAVVADADVPALAREHRQSIEVAGRHARHRALVAAAAELGADRVATGHTRDDQAETVLLHLTRGAGLSGARGIEPQSGLLIRPVLDCARAGLRGWLTTAGEPWREDETNADVANPRNRVRHVLLPALRDQLNPAVDAALVRFADILREDHAYLNEVAAEAAAQVVETRPDGLAVDGPALQRLPRALARRVARIALETAHVKRSYDLEEVDAVVDACSQTSGASRDLPGVRMERSGRFVVLHGRGTNRPVAEAFRYELRIPGQVSIEESHMVLEAEGPFDCAQGKPFDCAQGKPFDSAQGKPFDCAQGKPFDSAQGKPFDSAQGRPVDAPVLGEVEGPNHAVVGADELGDGLVVRNRRHGDRLRLWKVGHKKLQDLFVDRKVDRADRDRVPIVTDRAGRIVWVAGHAVAEEFRVGPLTNTVVVLRLRSLQTGVESAGRQS